MDDQPPVQPFLRWAGSKRKLLHVLSPYWTPNFNRYIEPFTGSACLFFKLDPQKAILSDLNSELINTYLAVLNSPFEVADKANKLPKGEKAYYRIRTQSVDELDPISAAARFIYLNRFCFNGLFRTNLDGKFNVPYAPNKTGNLPSREKLLAVSEKLGKAQLLCGDFSKVLAKVKKNDFVYLDPPFAVEKKRIFREYGPKPFARSDLVRLAAGLEEIDKKGAAFVVSYAYCEEAVRIFSRWPRRRVLVQRNMAGFSKMRRRASELIVTNI